MTNVTPAIEARSLNYTFERWGVRVPALQDLTLSIKSGAWVNIIGSNGSGKSTFLKLLSGRLSPQEGSLTINGEAPPSIDALEGPFPTFMVHQDPMQGTASALTVFENLLVADSDAPTWKRRHLRRRYSEILEVPGLAGHLDQPVALLSGGQRQLLSLVIAQLRPSPIILLDEPFAALDPSRTQLGLAMVSDLHRAGRTILMVTHNTSLAHTYGDGLIEFNQGRAEWLVQPSLSPMSPQPDLDSEHRSSVLGTSQQESLAYLEVGDAT